MGIVRIYATLLETPHALNSFLTTVFVSMTSLAHVISRLVTVTLARYVVTLK